MGAMKMEPVPMDKPSRGHAHLELHTKAPKVHVGQKIKATVHGTVKEVAEGYDGIGHRIRIEPKGITYQGSPGDAFLRKETKRKY